MTIKKRLTLFLSIVFIYAFSFVDVKAEPNYKDEYFAVVLKDGAFSTSVRQKDTPSSIYLNLTQASFQGKIRVKILGTDSSRTVFENKTYAQGKYIDHFLVSAGQKYALTNFVNESKLSYVKLSFEGPYGINLSGCWSPDYTEEGGCIKAEVGTDKSPIVKPIAKKKSSSTKFNGDKLISVPYISQAGIPSGCECASAAMILNFYGYNISPNDFIKNHLDIEPIYSGIGPDPQCAFAGNPYKLGYGCFSKCIAKTMNKVFDKSLRAEPCCDDLSYLVENHLCLGRPLIIWITKDLAPMKPGDSWQIRGTGRRYIWPLGEHCVVLVGFDKDFYYVNDPLKPGGYTRYSKDDMIFSFNSMGRHAVVVMKVGK